MSLSDTQVGKLVTIVRDTPDAGLIVRVLVSRQRHKPTLDVYRIKLELNRGGHFVPIEKMITFFQRLESVGLGKLTLASLPQHPVWTWKVPVLAVIEALRTSLAVSKTTGRAAPSPTTTQLVSNTIRVYCPLRAAALPLTLPQDFNRADAEALSSFLFSVAEQNENS